MNKIIFSSLSFLALSPGLLLTIDQKGLGFVNGKTSFTAVVVHAFVFTLISTAYYSMNEKSDTEPADSSFMGLAPTTLIAAGLFIALSPGMLLTLPPVAGSGVFSSGKTSVPSTLVHTAVFAAAYSVATMM